MDFKASEAVKPGYPLGAVLVYVEDSPRRNNEERREAQGTRVRVLARTVD